MADTHKLRAIKAFRRQRIAALLDEHGKVGLSKLVDISPAYLWQMGRGTGKSARGVSDENAAKVESKLHKPTGWMDADVSETDDLPHSLSINRAIVEDVARTLQETYDQEHLIYSLAEEWELFADLYDEAIQGKLRSTGGQVKIGRWIERRIQQGANGDKGRTAVPAKGTHTRNKRVQR